MAGIADVAARILDNHGVMSTMKLQKLVFYAQAESLATTGQPLFSEDFQAWRGGPVSLALYRQHRGLFLIRPGQIRLIQKLGFLPSRPRLLTVQQASSRV
ncbi:Uncharacterized phage-associated protein [Trueperella bialowiezensis]|uniref:Uncharacterized phage-associated protein n=1 Tax=Trueperella bialowiezensis TaxID=312285 RepID=A0A3S4UYQ0_9ACTO|nr:Uncharacterized phage-associated protein [Trueperella bialowiezensis]